MLAFGMVGDEFGRKRVMLTGVAIFCGGSVLAALAPNIGLVIAGRAVMGFGAAASEPGTLSMLRHLYTDERARTRAVGVWAGVSGLALAVGPVIGGALVGVWDWRAIFWFNLAFGLVALAAGMIVLPENSDPDAHRVDIAGTVLGAAALSALVFAVIGGEDTGFTSASVVTLLCLSAVAAVAFFWWESRAAHPLLDLKFLRKPTFLTANVVAFCAYFATFAVFFFTALYLEEVVGDTGYQITLVFLPMTALMIAASLLAGRWTDPSGPRWSIFIGCLLFGAGLLLTTVTLNPHPAYLPLAAALALTGLGIGATVVPITSEALSAVPPARSGMAASATNTSREIGAVTGVAILGALVNAQLRSSLTSRLRHLGIPSNFQSIVIHAVETGGVPSNGNTAGAGGAAGAGQGTLVQEVIHAAYSAFYAGLRAALLLSAFLVLAAGLFTFVLLGRRAAGSDPH
jgi:EmrB/QacA subfamily drug resistance transporter